ncbi:MAG: 5-formyltetrahydrofolate cyclo-ligase [Pseudomonadales bacterium]|nr:5-formyltetrahydrofolate cyclo-ligase [Pseudomonadales bacterium]NRA18646.1 5-formyltetrahydrofolate cyclo-ligase [Oceanospirillaceae bacterium]
MEARQQLRRQMRDARKALSAEQQQLSGASLLHHLQQLNSFNSAEHIALYLASDGEIDPQSVIDHCWAMGKQVYLPVLDPDLHNQLLFVHYHNNTLMCRNKYAIEEPATPYQKSIPAAELDLVLLPLVAFDDQGNRMGMGGGYYDRSFAFMLETATDCAEKHLPVLIGLAHQLQQVDKLAVESWDIPLSGIVTNQRSWSSQS